MSLALGMFVLGRFYYVYVPFLDELGVIGAILLGSILLLFFLGLGWVYDAKANMWSQKIQVAVEKNPYYYVPTFKDKTTTYPVLYTILNTLEKVFEKKGLDTSCIMEIYEYLASFFSKQPIKKDIMSGLPDANLYLDSHFPLPKDDHGFNLIGKAKTVFETQVLRVSWIQSLTGMLQDALVFGILYVVILVPGLDDPILQILFGTFLISVPVYILLTLLGWYYDKRLKVWSSDAIVRIERNPYTYVPAPRELLLDVPFFYSFFTTMRGIFLKSEIEVEQIDRFMEYMSHYSGLTASRDQDMDEARKLRITFGPVFRYQGVDANK